MGFKESGGNPSQLKAGESSQPASKIGHFPLQIKKKKKNPFGSVCCRGMQRKRTGRKRQNKQNVCTIYGNFATSSQPCGVTCCHEMKRKKKKGTTNKSGNDSRGLSQHSWAAAFHDFGLQWEIPQGRSSSQPQGGPGKAILGHIPRGLSLPV